MSNDTIIAALKPVLAHLKALDLADTQTARESLAQQFPPGGELFSALRALADSGLREGWLCGREAGPSRFSRVAKPEKGDGYSIDAVLLWGDGPKHKHLKGEVNCMLALEGAPKFCGFEPGWAVFAPGSAHVPSVQGGKMLIFYMLPDGAVEW
ncbi:MAG: DUF4863 family protein [Planctomycetes bacterium]|nr:DUF4863 family protein [Planctomycetota bacterium]MCW8135690.1 DUF4863 family protein [Planctomycetota bacterium]